MPELPDVTVYIEALESRVAGRVLQRVKLMNPFIRTPILVDNRISMTQYEHGRNRAPVLPCNPDFCHAPRSLYQVSEPRPWLGKHVMSAPGHQQQPIKFIKQ